MSKLIYIVIAVLVIGGGVFLFNKNGSPKGNGSNMKNVSENVQSQNNVVKTNKVSYDGSAFSPAAIEVKLGDTVTFTNNGSAGMWVASAPHPTHTDYPAFDAKKSYATGESYTFTFDKVGSWKYHNHFSPSSTGLVIVK